MKRKKNSKNTESKRKKICNRTLFLSLPLTHSPLFRYPIEKKAKEEKELKKKQKCVYDMRLLPSSVFL